MGTQGSRRGGIIAGLVQCNSRLIEEVHDLVNETRRERGLPPWDFTKPRRNSPHYRPETYSARLDAAKDLEGLRGELIRARLRRSLSQATAAQQIGLQTYQLSMIERGIMSPEGHLLVMIQFWLHLEE